MNIAGYNTDILGTEAVELGFDLAAHLKENPYEGWHTLTTAEYPSNRDKVLELKELVDNYNQEKTTMNKMKDQAITANVGAVKVAAMITAGGVLNETLLTKLRPQLPMLMRGYAYHALADVILANIANFAITNFVKDNEQAVLASEAMMLAAMTKLTQSFNIEALIAEVLAEVKLPTFPSSDGYVVKE